MLGIRSASAALTACAVALGLTCAGGVTEASAAASGRHTGPEVRSFLVSFYGQHGPSTWERAHQVSTRLKERQEENPGYDVLLCAQNTPQRITIGTVTVGQSAGYGWATVTTHWGGGSVDAFTAYVALESDPIELGDVVCGS